MRFMLAFALLCTLMSGLGFSLQHVRRSSVANQPVISSFQSLPASADEVCQLRLELESQWGRAFPPPGATCAIPWEGFNAHGALFQVAACNCFESVCYLTSGDPTNFAYRAWPAETLADLDAVEFWPVFEKSLHRGDVVEFILHSQRRGSSLWSTPFHAQICAADGGLMFGANNEPRFMVVHGVPTETMRWDFCTTHQYYDALKSMEQAWRDCGEEHTYNLVIHRRVGGSSIDLAHP